MNSLCTLATIIALMVDGWLIPYFGGDSAAMAPSADPYATLAPGETQDPAATIDPTQAPDPAATQDPHATAATYGTLTAEQAKARMDSGDGLIILDVRTTTEYEAGHIPNAVLLPNELIGSNPPSELPDKHAEILVYCRTGVRAAEASQKLVDMGYTRVYSFGGISTWPYDIVK